MFTAICILHLHFALGWSTTYALTGFVRALVTALPLDLVLSRIADVVPATADVPSRMARSRAIARFPEPVVPILTLRLLGPKRLLSKYARHTIEQNPTAYPKEYGLSVTVKG